MKTTPASSEEYTSDYYNNRCGGFEFFKIYRDKILKPQLQWALQESGLVLGETVLDLGCGRGELASHLTQKGFQVTAVDFSEDAIKMARDLFPKVDFRCGDINAMDFPPQSFDVVFFLGAIEHLTDGEIEKILRRLHSWMKPRGRLIITTCVNRWYYKTLTYRWRLWGTRKLNQWGLKIREPRAPRSEEDLKLHINEQTPYTLARLANQTGWKVRVIPYPNPKMVSRRLYGPTPPPDLPLRLLPRWKQTLYSVVFLRPLSFFLGRSYLAKLKSCQSAS